MPTITELTRDEDDDANINVNANGNANADVNANASRTSFVSRKRQPPLSKLILAAISELNDRTGSSVMAIAKFIKSSGYEVKDQQRFNKSVLLALKRAISLGKVTQMKRSFKLTASEKKKKKSKAKSKKIKTKAKRSYENGYKLGQAKSAINKKASRKKSKNSPNAKGGASKRA